MWRILFEEFIGDLRQQKLRAMLTLLAVVGGTAAVVILLAFGEGLKRQVVAGQQNAGSRMFMIYGGETSLAFEGLPKGREIRLTQDDLDLLRTIPEADRFSASYGRWGVTVKTPTFKTTVFLEGALPDHEDLRVLIPAAHGRFFNEPDITQRRRVAFLGDSIALKLFGKADPIGRQVMIDELPFTVVGVLQHKFQTSSNNGPDMFRVLIPATTYRTIYGNRYVSHLLIRPTRIEDASFVKHRIFEVIGKKYHFDPNDERALPMWDFVEDARETRAIGLGIQIFLGIVGGFTLLVAGVGVANIMYVTVKERTREIGVKMAVGARKQHVMAQFLFEALLLSFGGGMIGLSSSSLLVVLVDSMHVNNMAMEFLLNPKLSWPIGATTVAILSGIGLAAGVFPARKAAAIQPIESLRYE
ncbi:MAG TPA: ABC transporter permease [Longimicrobiales bacterium]